MVVRTDAKWGWVVSMFLTGGLVGPQSSVDSRGKMLEHGNSPSIAIHIGQQ